MFDGRTRQAEIRVTPRLPSTEAVSQRNCATRRRRRAYLSNDSDRGEGPSGHVREGSERRRIYADRWVDGGVLKERRRRGRRSSDAKFASADAEQAGRGQGGEARPAGSSGGGADCRPVTNEMVRAGDAESAGRAARLGCRLLIMRWWCGGGCVAVDALARRKRPVAPTSSSESIRCALVG